MPGNSTLNGGRSSWSKPAPGDLVRVGPFRAGRIPFVVDCNAEEMATSIADQFQDLRVSSAHDRPSVFLVARRGPAWLNHSWNVWTDDEPSETFISADRVPHYLVTRLTQLLIDESALSLVPVRAAAVVRDGSALLLAGGRFVGKSTLAAWLTAHGWHFVSDGVTLIDQWSGEAPVVHPFWRPIVVRSPGPLDEFATGLPQFGESLVPASRFGSLGGATRLGGIIIVERDSEAESPLRPESSAKSVAALSAQLSALGARARPVFRVIADIAASAPAYRLRIDDLAAASAALGDLATGAQ